MSHGMYIHQERHVRCFNACMHIDLISVLLCPLCMHACSLPLVINLHRAQCTETFPLVPSLPLIFRIFPLSLFNVFMKRFNNLYQTQCFCLYISIDIQLHFSSMFAQFVTTCALYNIISIVPIVLVHVLFYFIFL